MSTNTTAARTVQISAGDSIHGKLLIDWGDGVMDTWAAGVVQGSHTYAYTDTYRIQATDDAGNTGITELLVALAPVIRRTVPDRVEAQLYTQILTLIGHDFAPGITKVYLDTDAPETVGQRHVTFNPNVASDISFVLYPEDLIGVDHINVIVQNGDVAGPPFEVLANLILPVGANEADLLIWAGTDPIRQAAVLKQELLSPNPRRYLVNTLQAALGLPITIPTPGLSSVVPGTPGSWGPAGAALPQTLGALNAHPTVGHIGTNAYPYPWSDGEFVELPTNPVTEVYWDGTQWQLGRTPHIDIPVSAVQEGAPGSFLPIGVNTIPDSLAKLQTHTEVGDQGINSPSTAWTSGSYVELSDTGKTKVFWTGTHWLLGVAGVLRGIATTADAQGLVKFVPENPTGVPTAIGDLRINAVIGDVAYGTAHPHAWDNGEHIEYTTSGGTHNKAHFDGTTWQVGVAPTTIQSVAVGAPGEFRPTTHTVGIPADLAALKAHKGIGEHANIAAGVSVWTAGQYVVLGDASKAYWDGATWKVGVTP